MNERLRGLVARNVTHPLDGIRFGDWCRLLRRHRFAVHPRYWPRAAVITAASLTNSLNVRREEREFDQEIEAARVLPPVFILGHCRSGTTHLHNLLAVDPRFA